MKRKEIWFLVVLISIVLVVQGWSLSSKPRVTINKDSPQQEETIKQRPEKVIPKSQTAPVIQPQRQGVPKSTLTKLALDELELLGTAIGNIKDPIAFIKDLKTGQQGMYRLGRLIRGAKIVKIVMGEVFFEKDGQTGILSLSKRGRLWCKVDQETSAIVSVSENQIVVSKRGVLREAGNIHKTLSSVKIKPHYQSDEIVGLMIDGISQGSLIEEAGIRNNDIITQVNSQKINSYQKALQVFRKIRNQSDIRVSLLRDGQSKVLCYRIDQ